MSKSKKKYPLIRVYIEYNPNTKRFFTAYDGSNIGITLAIAHAISTHPTLLDAFLLANSIRGTPSK